MDQKVPEKKYSDWKKELPDHRKVVIYVIGFMLMFMFVYTFISNAAITGSAAVNPAASHQRFTGTTTLLLVIFAFFGLFIFMVTRRLNKEK